MKKFSKSIGIAMPACRKPAGGRESNTYTVTIQSDDNGSASASKTIEVAQGEIITITATPNAKRFFKHWQVVSGGAFLAGTTEAETTFTMPAGDVTIKACFFSLFGYWADDTDNPALVIELVEDGDTSWYDKGSGVNTFLLKFKEGDALANYCRGIAAVYTSAKTIVFIATEAADSTGAWSSDAADTVLVADFDVTFAELSLNFEGILYTLINADISAPIEIADQADLAKIGVDSDFPLDGNYKVVQNITLSGTQTPIGSWSETDAGLQKPFTGTFDGNGKTIRGLNIDGGNSGFQGLFAYIGTDGMVKNLVVSGIVKSADAGNGTASYIGGITGWNDGTISSVAFSGKVSGRNAVGGIAGANLGIIENSYNTADITGTASNVGGITGRFLGGYVSFTYNTGTISGTRWVGGIAGEGNVSNSISLGLKVTASEAEYAGRIVGDGSGINNKARSNMKVNGSLITNRTASNINGVDINTIQWGSSSWWTGIAGWDTAIWDFSGVGAGSYPQLKVFQ